MRRSSPEAVRGLEITGELDRAAAEALQLEVRRLLRRHGLEAGAIVIEKIAGDARPSEPA
jgi:hypothetical protein